MFGTWELCISVQDKMLRMLVCRFNKRVKKIEIKNSLEIEIPNEFESKTDITAAKGLAGIVKNVLKDSGINIKKYNLCIGDREIITRVIKLPKMDFKDLNSFMKLSISQYFPINADEYSFDYKIQDINDKDDKEYYNLFLVAIPKATIVYYSNLFLQCGLRPKLIDIYYDVVSNIFINIENMNTAVVDIGRERTEFMMIEGKNIFINSTIDYSISNNKREISISNMMGTEEGDSFLSTCDALKNYLDFFSSRHLGKSVEELYFIGEGIIGYDTKSYLEESLNVKIKTGQDIIDNKLIVLGGLKEEFLPQKYFSCLGLVIGGMGK